jgi:predicted dehydrogenase
MTTIPKLKFGMVGGGTGSFVGWIHRHAAIADGKAEWVAGALASTPERGREAGEMLGLALDRTYGTWQEMLEAEQKLPVGKRIAFVCIVTPNHVHYEPAMAFVEAGFNVVLDKPMVHTWLQAQALIAAVERNGVQFCVTYNYTGYPMVKEARDWVRTGKLGILRRVVVEYPQGWLRDRFETQGNKQAEWRTDPSRTGIAGAIGDIGTHCESLAAYITGLELEAVCADVSTFVDGRMVDDDASVLLRYRNGVKGVLWVSQVAAGGDNGLNIRVYGTDGGLYWNQEQPNELYFYPGEGPVQVSKRGHSYLCPAARRAARLPGGLNEAYLEAFANLYVNYIDSLIARRSGKQPNELERDFPTVYDGARGVRFVERVVASGQASSKWIPFIQ